MGRAPRESVVKRLIMSVDKDWKDASQPLTVLKGYANQADIALLNMIPECIALYSETTAHNWFTNKGLLAFHHIKWNQKPRMTKSNADNETRQLVDKDIFRLGSDYSNVFPPCCKIVT